MIHNKNVRRFCSEPLTMIENYKEAVNDTEQSWHCHHRKETDEGLSRKELIEMGLYYHRPASELIFLSSSEHRKLHANSMSPEHRSKISAANKGRTNTWANKAAETRKRRGYKHSLETREKIAEAHRKIKKGV